MSGTMQPIQGVDMGLLGSLMPKPPASGLAGLMQSQELAKTGLENQAQAMQLRARAAMGPILQNSIGPDGQIDWSKAVIGMAQHPDAAWMAGDVMNQAVQRQLTQAQTMKTALEGNIAKQKNINDALAGLLPLGANVKQGDVAERLALLQATGTLSPQETMTVLSHIMPFGDGPKLAQFIQHEADWGQGAEKTMQSLWGTISQQNVGGKTVAVQSIPRFGVSAPVGAVAHSMSPDAYYKPQEVVGPGGQKTAFPVGPLMGADAPGAPQGSGAKGWTGGVPTANSLALTEYQSGKGPVADYEQRLNREVSTGQNLYQQLVEVQHLLPQLGTGAFSEGRTALANVAKSLGLSDNLVNAIQGGKGPDALSAAQQAVKLLVRNAVNTLGTDMEGNRKTEKEIELYLSSASPNINMTAPAIEGIINFTKMLLNQKVSEQKFFNSYKGTQPDGTVNYTPQFLTNPQGYAPIWAGALQKLYKGKEMYNDIKSAGRQAFPEAYTK